MASNTVITVRRTTTGENAPGEEEVLGNGYLINSRGLLLESTVATRLLDAHGLPPSLEVPARFEIADCPLTVRTEAPPDPPQTLSTSGTLHVITAPGVAPLAAVDLVEPANGSPISESELPEPVQQTLSQHSGLPRKGFGPGDPPPPPEAPWCTFFPGMAWC